MHTALAIGKFIGILAYYFDYRHKAQTYANLKMAFAESKSPDELRKITKQLFKNYGQNFIELFRLPLLTPEKFKELVKIEGKEHVAESLKQGKGLILLAMHFGSWELASLSCAMFDYPYKVIVKPQNKYTQLDNLLNSYRECNGSVVLSRGLGTRDFVKSLKNNEIIGMVVDQGGRDGVRVPFFGRQASMSVGAIRMGLKWGVPICFCIIVREKGPYHRMIVHPPLELTKTDNFDQDVVNNLEKISQLMEKFIQQYPSEYMWFYKIWKYSKQSNICIISDGKTGHLRQSECIGRMVQDALKERDIQSSIETIQIVFKNKFYQRFFSLLSRMVHPVIYQGRLEFLKQLLTKESFQKVMAVKADFFVSCGSSVAGINYWLSQDHNAKAIAILKPGMLTAKHFDLLFLPQHDVKTPPRNQNVVITKAAPNLITPQYLKEQSEVLLKHFSHLKQRLRTKIGVFIGGDAKDVYLSENMIRLIVHQLKQICNEMNADILLTTSRRTPSSIDHLLIKELKKFPNCPLLIIANKENIPEAVGGILGLADIAVVSGDSISMVSEAASSGKQTIVFSPHSRAIVLGKNNKHVKFIDNLNKQGFIVSADVKNVGQAVFDVIKNKIHTRQLQDNKAILEAVRKVI